MAVRTILFFALILATPKAETHPAIPASATAQRVFDRLVAELPSRLKPDADPYQLIVFDPSGKAAFTTRGAIIYIARPTVERLLADKGGGDSALAFVLADEIGHIALGHRRHVMAEKHIIEAAASYLPYRLPSPQWGYTAAEQEDADRFALHLCRNAGFDLDAALDSVRLDADRLKRLVMERDGLFDDQTRYGLFLFDRRSCRLTRCGPRQIGPDERPIVLVHGLRGNEWALGAYLGFFRDQPEIADRPLLVFRYPNNESLSRCGQFMTREIQRVMVDPERAVFVCHSAGGLVFRWYAEVRHGGFAKAIFLAVPNAGTHMANLKGFVDVGRFLLDLHVGLDYAMRNCFGEGGGEIARDLIPDSLFLRRLNREAPPVERYQIFYGQFLDLWQALELRAGFLVAKGCVEEVMADLVPFPDLQDRLMRLTAKAPLPEEITRGDLVVSARSAQLPGVTRTTALAAQHEAFRYDPEIMRRVLEAILR